MTPSLMSQVSSQSSFQAPRSKSRPPLGHLPEGDIAPQDFDHSSDDNSLERVPSSTSRARSSRGHPSTPSSQLGQDRLPSPPTHAADKHTETPFGYEALRRDLRNIFKEELHETLRSPSHALFDTDEPSWVDVLRRDMQNIFKKEMPELIRAFTRHPDSRFHGADAVATRGLEKGRAEMSAEEQAFDETSHTARCECPRPGGSEDVPDSNRGSWKMHKRPSVISNVGSERDHDTAILADLRCHLARHSDCAPATTTAQNIKDIFRVSTSGKAFDVRTLYKKEGFFQAVARSKVFDCCSVAMIVLYSIWMSIDTDLNGAESILDSDFVFFLADVIFYTYFLGELLIRFLAFRRKADCCKDWWFVFDSVAVIMYTVDPFAIIVVELSVGVVNNRGALDALRLLRLGRLSRLTRLLRHMPEMLFMIKGIFTALASVGYTLGLLGLVTYVFAIALRRTVPTDSTLKTKYFSTVPSTMNSLVMHGTFLDDLSGFTRAVNKDSAFCLILSWLFIMFSALLMMNMLVGVLCQVIATVATQEKEYIISDQISKQFRQLFGEFDYDEDGLLGWEEFARLLESEATQRALKKFDVDVDALVDMVEDMFFYSYDAIHGPDAKITIGYTQVIDLILQLRGSQPASVKDVMAIGKRFNAKLHELKECLPITAAPNRAPIHE